MKYIEKKERERERSEIGGDGARKVAHWHSKPTPQIKACNKWHGKLCLSCHAASASDV